MVATIIFVLFIFMSASLANTFADAADRPDTKRYPSDWPFREHVKNVGTTKSALESTTEKVIQYANGWRPIIVSRSLHYDRDPRFKSRPTEKVINIGSHRDKHQTHIPWKWKADAAEELSFIDSKYSAQSSAGRSQTPPFSYLKLHPNETSPPSRGRHNAYLNDRNMADASRLSFRQYPERRKKSKIEIKEDDIMWMHYHPLGQVPKVLPFMSRTQPEVSHTDTYEYNNDMMMQETNSDPLVTYPSRITMIDQTQTSSSPTFFTTLATSRPSYSRNTYEVIDTNNKDNFRPMTTTTTTTTKKTTEEMVATTELSDDGTWQDFYNSFYSSGEEDSHAATEDESTLRKPNDRIRASAAPLTVEKDVKDIGEAKRNRRLFNVTKSEKAHQEDSRARKILPDQQNDVIRDDKSDKNSYFAKPIVITDPSRGEYYDHLFDSFGGNSLNENKASDEDFIETRNANETRVENSTEIHEIMDRNDEDDDDVVEEVSNMQTANQTTLASHESSQTASTTRKDVHKLDGVKVDGVKKNILERGDPWNFLFNMTGVQFTDLLPVTLKTNIFFVKKLIVECHSDLEKTENLSGNTFSCLKKITFTVLDRAVQSDVIKITDSVSLVKENNTAVEQFSSSRSSTDEDSDWLSNVLGKIQKLFSTHSLKIQLMNPQEKNTFQVEGRRRHYRRVFPIMVGAYMILSTVLIPLGFKFMTLLGTKSLLVSKLSMIIAMMGSIRKYMGYSNDTPQVHYPTYYPYPPPYYDPWRRDEFRKSSNVYDEPAEYAHWEEME